MYKTHSLIKEYLWGQAGSLWEQRGCETSYFLSIDMPTHDESKITYECLKIKGKSEACTLHVMNSFNSLEKNLIINPITSTR